MKVEVVYMGPDTEFIATIEVAEGTTVVEAIQCAKLLERHAEISLEKQSVGIFSKEVTLQTILQPDDRVEVYRPLKKDPKESRRLRAKFQGED